MMLAVKLIRFLYRIYFIFNKKRRDAATPILQCWNSEKLSSCLHWKEVEYLVIDIETSALDPRRGEILSIGWVLIKNGKSILATAEYFLLRPQKTVGNSATVHSLRDCDLQSGFDEKLVLDHLLSVAKGRILVFHHATLDTKFLNHLSRKYFGLLLVLPVIDTLRNEKNILNKNNIPMRPSVLRLASCRARYNLPAYPAHNALTDALATAELFLAQMAYKNGKITVGDLL